MRPCGRRAVVTALLLGAAAIPAPAAAQSAVELARARQALEDYFVCERTGRFAPCWPGLSRRVREEWARQGRGSAAEYAESRGAAAPRYADFRVIQIRRSPARVVFVVEATRAADRDGLPDRAEFAVLREGEQWKIDGRRVGPSETTP